MLDFLSRLLDTQDFPARWYCGNWSPGLGWLHIGSDIAIWAAYLSIPLIIGFYAFRRRDISFPIVAWLFAGFIFFCGTTHLIDAVIFWWPAYRLLGVMKLLTAIVSWLTVLALIRIIPAALELPGVNAMNALLRAEVARREAVERKLIEKGAFLDSEVRARTFELERANAQLQRSNVELETKSQEVEAFVYIVSHDLRAPLVNIQGFCGELLASCQELRDIVDKSELAPEIQQQLKQITNDDIAGALRFIKAGTSRFERLIDALLRLSRTGRQEFRLDKVDVNALVQNAVDSLQATINSKDAAVQVDAMPDAFGDKTALEQVFSNLLANALNYLDPARKGNISIGGRVENEYSHYWIADNGLGLPAGAKERIFQVFQRFHPNSAPGEGMGLAIAKRVVERHEGNIWVESTEGEGTTFHFRLPMQTADTDNTSEGNEVNHG